MKRKNCGCIKIAIIALAIYFSITSCQVGTIEIQRYRNRPKDPELIGEWLSLTQLSKLKMNPEIIEDRNKRTEGIIVGVVYYANGNIDYIKLFYSPDKAKPILAREPDNYVYYTQDGYIKYILGYSPVWESPYKSVEKYRIRGDLLYIEDYDVLERKTITVDLFPRRVVK